MADRPTPKKPRRSQLARQEVYRLLVMNAAEALFAEKGFDETKVEEIAREAEIAPGTLYSVFPGKAAILTAIRERHEEQILSPGEEAVTTGEPPLEQIAAMVRAAVEYYASNTDYLRISLSAGETWSAQPTRARHVPPWQRSLDLFGQAFELGIRDGSLRPGRSQVYARMALSVIQARLTLWLEEGTREDPAAVAEETVQLVTSAVRA